jgi:hypothetical protein
MAKPKPKTSSAPTSDLCPYELEVFMEKHGAEDAAGVILHTNGPSRAPCDYAAEAFLRFKTFLCKRCSHTHGSRKSAVDDGEDLAESERWRHTNGGDQTEH